MVDREVQGLQYCKSLLWAHSSSVLRAGHVAELLQLSLGSSHGTHNVAGLLELFLTAISKIPG